MLERLDTLIAFITVLLGVSLLITILNQMISSLLGHRATYLRDGIKDLLTTLDPRLLPHAEKIVQDVMTNRLASDSVFVRVPGAPLRWKMATTIRPDELTRLLSAAADGKPYAANIESLIAEVNPALVREAAMVNQLAPGAANQGIQLVKEISNSTTKAVSRLEAAFNSTMDRVKQRFTLQMRIWTIVFAALFAFVYHMDARKIYAQLSASPQLRTIWTGMSASVMQQYEKVAGAQSQNNEAARNQPEDQTASNTTENQAGNTSAQKGKATGGRVHPPAIQIPASGPVKPAETADAGVNSAKPSEDHQNEDQQKADEIAKQHQKQLSDAYTKLSQQLSDSNLSLLTIPDNWYVWKSSELLGILYMTALLSLGAPFWYNVLKNFVNLRSQVAQKQQQEAKENA